MPTKTVSGSTTRELQDEIERRRKAAARKAGKVLFESVGFVRRVDFDSKKGNGPVASITLDQCDDIELPISKAAAKELAARAADPDCVSDGLRVTVKVLLRKPVV